MAASALAISSSMAIFCCSRLWMVVLACVTKVTCCCLKLKWVRLIEIVK